MSIITLNGIEYTPVVPTPTGNRVVAVLDRGWIFAGDLSVMPDGKYKLERAINVRRWESIAFHGMIADPKSPKVKLDVMPQPVIFAAGTELFTVPVADDWGL